MLQLKPIRKLVGFAFSIFFISIKTTIVEPKTARLSGRRASLTGFQFPQIQKSSFKQKPNCFTKPVVKISQ
jgi:hypothetical protein